MILWLIRVMKKMLTNENYFSIENNLKYMSNSQYKMLSDCESMGLAVIKGEYQQEKTISLLVGSYVDSYFSGTLDLFKQENPDIFTKKGLGPLKSDFEHANYIIQRIERDAYFMKFLQGEKQVIKTREICGIPFKIKIDSYFPGKVIVDLKIIKDMDKIWSNGLYLNFIEYWGYDTQAALYSYIEGNNLPFFIAAATKEKEPDLALISIPQDRLDYCLNQVKENVLRFADIKKGLIEPTRCEHCDFCKSSKILTEIIDYSMLG
jgi:hypothetical protein